MYERSLIVLKILRYFVQDSSIWMVLSLQYNYMLFFHIFVPPMMSTDFIYLASYSCVCAFTVEINLFADFFHYNLFTRRRDSKDYKTSIQRQLSDKFFEKRAGKKRKLTQVTKTIWQLVDQLVLNSLTLISMGGGHYGPYSFSSISPERLEPRPLNFLTFSFYLLAISKI